MSIPDDTSTNAAPPTSPKRAAQDDLATEPESQPPATKRSRATSPSQDDDDDDDSEAKTRATTAAMANASLTAGEGEGERDVSDVAAAAQTTQIQTQPAAEAAAHETPETTTTQPPPSAPKTKMCGVCHEKEGKYKCTRCALPLYVLLFASYRVISSKNYSCFIIRVLFLIIYIIFTDLLAFLSLQLLRPV